MKAVRFHEHGGPEVLRYEDAPDPTIAPHEVLVKVKACALNHLDLWCRKGMLGITIPLPHICGSDIAGEVAAVGSIVTRITPGQRVVVSPGVSCGQCVHCLSGHDNLCHSYQIVGGYRIDGGYAEYVKIQEVNILPIPEGMSFEAAAAFPLTTLLKRFTGKVINIHPALLPAFPGLHGVRQAIAAGVRVSGCTVHFVDEGTDTGPIIAQAAVPVLPGDDEASLGERIHAEEHRLYPAVVRAIARGAVRLDGRRVQLEEPL